MRRERWGEWDREMRRGRQREGEREEGKEEKERGGREGDEERGINKWTPAILVYTNMNLI